MKRTVLIVGLAVFVMAVAIGWQFAGAYIGNVELHEDVRDVASQNSVNIGLNPPRSNQEIRVELIRAAAEHGVQIGLDQIALKKYTDASTHRVWYDVTVDYNVPINLLVYSYQLHFVQSNTSPTPLQPKVRPDTD